MQKHDNTGAQPAPPPQQSAPETKAAEPPRDIRASGPDKGDRPSGRTFSDWASI